MLKEGITTKNISNIQELRGNGIFLNPKVEYDWRTYIMAYNMNIST